MHLSWRAKYHKKSCKGALGYKGSRNVKSTKYLGRVVNDLNLNYACLMLDHASQKRTSDGITKLGTKYVEDYTIFSYLRIQRASLEQLRVLPLYSLDHILTSFKGNNKGQEILLNVSLLESKYI
ncbi:unnamed protein product [Lepeophtheirus salmonis]|uniref:(salmon louse) hypothetical protein n=1 Tax=Lepeophtheirus salmonis TaxID=72036 RepID=A0A7R8D521_LEPSM|nr:unnamed protein product [Lepeophtheirus salmonis]CAF3030803.1 unnamed protein product [Lepeophtheirus salmonis]